MFENLELRKVKNGFIVIVNTEDGQEEYVFDNARKALKLIKDCIDGKNDSVSEE